MNFWTPQTGKMGNGWTYTYDADKIRGFKQTHQPSPWMNDYGQFAIMPVTGKLQGQLTYVVVDAYDKGSYIKVLPEQRKIVGYSTRYARGPLPKNSKNYFVIDFDKPFSSTHIWSGDKLVEGVTELASAHSGAVVGFKTEKGEKVGMRVASSFISEEQAELNLKRELASDSFDTTAQCLR